MRISTATVRHKLSKKGRLLFVRIPRHSKEGNTAIGSLGDSMKGNAAIGMLACWGFERRNGLEGIML